MFLFIIVANTNFQHGDFGVDQLDKPRVNAAPLYHPVWSRTHPAYGIAWDLALSFSEDIYLVSDGSSSGKSNVVKYSKSGFFQWDYSLDGEFRSIALDSGTNLYIAGYTADYDMILTKLSGSGNFIWSRVLDKRDYDYIYAVAVDNSDNIYMAGMSYNYPPSGQNRDIILVKYSSSGTYLWDRTLDIREEDYCKGITTDSSNNVYLTGYHRDFTTTNDIFIAKYSSLGTLQWSKNFDVWNLDDEAEDIALDSSNNIFVTGSTQENYAVLLKFNSAGNLQWSRVLGGTGINKGYSIDIASDGDIFIGGVITSPTTGILNVLIHVYDSTGSSKWMETRGGLSNDMGRGIAVSSLKNVYVGGDFNDELYLLKYELAPSITINSPSPNSLYSFSAPSFDVDITDSNLIETFYTVNGGSHYTFMGSTGIINQAAWDVCPQGTVSLKFYGRDTAGLVYKEVIVIKDILPPDFEIISPTTYQLSTDTAPNYELSTTDTDIKTISYTLNGGVEIITSSLTGTIDQTAWNTLDNGSVLIEFFLEDDIGYITSESVEVYKNYEIPIISINNPSPNQFYGLKAPDYSISTSSLSPIIEMWYSLNNGQNITITETYGYINQTEWDLCGNGTVTVIFHAKNTLGNVGIAEITVRKDIYFPFIDIYAPQASQISGNSPPNYNVSITGVTLDTKWYTLNFGGEVHFLDDVGIIDKFAWDACGNGPVVITFYANNTGGISNSKEISIYKDDRRPNITIISPSPAILYGLETINFSISIIESQLEKIWYTLNGGIEYSLVGTNGTIDQGVWDSYGNGTVTLSFYANNTLGNIGLAEIVIRKDVYFPFITIISPESEQWYGINAPDYNFSISSLDVDSMWYSLNYGANYTIFTTVGTFDQFYWENYGSEDVTITFYANNSYGQLSFESIEIKKTVTAPNVTIFSPQFFELFGIETINFNVSITDPSLDSTWYTLNGGIEYSLIGNSGTIDQGAWDSCGNGTVNLSFYANNTLGNIGLAEIVVRKDVYFPFITIISPESEQWYGINAPDYNFSISSLDVDSMWYSLNDGANDTIYTKVGTFDQFYWDNYGSEDVKITFYANNSYGQLNFESVEIKKNITVPNVTIFSPQFFELFGIETINFNVSITDPSLDSTWFTLNGGDKFFFTNNYGIINQSAWDVCGNGTVSIIFFANNSLGNIGYAEVTVYRDQYYPFIEIIKPINNQLVGPLAPSFNITVSSYAIDSMWYVLNYSTIGFYLETEGMVDQSKWDFLGAGFITISFYANNTYGQINFKEIIVRKVLEVLEKTAYAIVVGIADYPGSSDDLSYTDDDAIAVYNMLIDDYNFRPENIIYLQDSSATKNGISNAFDTISSIIKPDDIFYFYYSGHGGSNIVNNGPSTLYIQSPHFYPNNYDRTWWISSSNAAYIRVHFELLDLESDYDYLYIGDTGITEGYYYQSLTGYNSNFWSDWIPVLNDNRIYLNLVTDSSVTDWGFRVDQIEVMRYDNPHYINPYDSIPNSPSNNYLDTLLDSKFDSINSDNKYLIIDACNSGGLIPEVQDSDRFIITASKSGQLSYETSLLNHGIFTYYLLDSLDNANDLNNDGVISMEEIFSYVSSGTRSFSGSFGPGYQYQPQKSDGIIGEAVLYPSIGLISINPVGNQLFYSFYLYGHGFLKTLNITVASISPTITFKTEEIKYNMISATGFGYYSGIINLTEGFTAGGIQLFAEIEGNQIITIDITIGDSDGDGLTDIFEILYGNGLDPNSNDTDSDGLNDFEEFYGPTDPLNGDTDSDGLLDGEEVNVFGTDPLLDDTDSDSLTDYEEINTYNTDPLSNDSDSDNLYDGDEINIYHTNPLNNDTDSDNLSDSVEVNTYNTNPLSNDTDSDLLLDFEEIFIYNTSPLLNDTDYDGISDYDEIFIYNTSPLEEDTDSDGLSDYDELNTHTTDPLNADTDSDTIPDGWEVNNLLDPLTNDTALDPDNDLLTNLEEYQFNTEPFNNDTDSDGLFDGEEVNNYNTEPLQADTDSDGLLDGEEVNTYNTDPLQEDTDSDGLLDGEEVNTYNTDPLSGDTDSDTMPDKWEIDNLLNPSVNDTTLDPDNDLLVNIFEYLHGTDPQDPDTDNDGWTDGDEVLVYDTDPLDPDDHPNPRQDQAIPGYPLGFVIIITAITVTIWLIGYKKKRFKR